jgi:serine/threonine protein kinase/tetratricopeptide (TPR) repeat protein
MDASRSSFGRYEVLGAIGEGGMGEVYVARDPSLGRRVAIKKLPPRLATDRDTLARFTHEARSASALNHPNIVTIHEVGTADGGPYIVMEYIEGADLRSMVRDGPLPVRRVLDIGTQIADGLAAAHERGIVHRDLKPENIMVTRDGFVKILDFGLAKTVTPQRDGSGTLELEMPGTSPGTILGTVGYMSPEQATGKRLDFRSDQFALGSILYELATGKPAFEAENAIDTLSAILHDNPTPLARANPRAPVQLSEIIRRLLEKKADGRYASTRDLAHELRLLRERVIAEESGFHTSASRHEFRSRRVAAILGALGLAAVLVAVFFINRPPSVPTAKKYLAVLSFKDLSGDPNGQLVVDGFAETLTARLARFPSVQVMPRPSEANADPKKIARDLGANLVLTGTMMRSGNRIRVTYSIADPDSRREWHDLVEGNVADLFSVQDDVAESVAKNLALGGTTPTRPALDTKVSQRRYLEALGHLRRYDSEQSLDSAITILKELGQSPSVQAALARAYLYKFQITREPDLAAAATQAAEQALKADPQSIDVNITMGELHRRTGRYKESIDAFVRVLSQQPTNAEAVLDLAEAYKAAGDSQKAVQQYKRAIELQPHYWGGYNKLGAFYMTQGRYADSIPLFEKVTALIPDSERGYNNLGGAYQRLGRYEEALRVSSQSVQRAPSGQGYTNLGTCYYFLGKYSEAAAAFEKATQITVRKPLYWRNLGDAHRRIQGQKADAVRAYTRTIELCDDALKLNPNDASAHRMRGSALAKIGRVQEARSAILRALELEPRLESNAYEAAVIANIAGSEDETVSYIEQALRLGYTADNIRRDPEFANLQKSGRLDAVITAFQSKRQ